MRILVRSEGNRDIKLMFPTWMIFNGFTGTVGAGIVNKYVDFDEGIRISPHDLRRLMREINNIKRKYPDLCLVDIQSANGDIVKITL